MRTIGKALVLAMATTGIASLCVAQSGQTANRISFDVVSVKANKSGSPLDTISTTGCRFIATNATVSVLLNFAYHPRNGQLRRNEAIGGPAWIDTDRFDVQAIPEGGVSSLQQSDMQARVQSLLEDRFQLKLHHETRELPVYDLVIGKETPKLNLSEDQTPPQDSAAISCTKPSPEGIHGGSGVGTAERLPRGVTKMTGVSVTRGAITMTISANAAPLSDFTNLLKAYAGRPVLDKTNLQGLYSFTLHFSLENSGSRSTDPDPGNTQVVRGADPSGATLLLAIQQQLGLKLESTKEPVDVLVIDSVQRPSEN